METGKMKLALSAGALALSMALAGCGGSSSSSSGGPITASDSSSGRDDDEMPFDSATCTGDQVPNAANTTCIARITSCPSAQEPNAAGNECVDKPEPATASLADARALYKALTYSYGNGDAVVLASGKIKITVTGAAAPIPASLTDLSKADTTVAKLGDWTGAHYTKDTGTGNAKVTAEARVYSNPAAAKQVSIRDTTNPAGLGTFTSGAFAAPNDGWTGVASKIVLNDLGTSGTKTLTAAEQASGLKGSFMGATGTYKCTGSCTAAPATGGGVTLAGGGTWTFMPDAGAMVAVEDANYLRFGWWLRKDRDGATHASAFYGRQGTPHDHDSDTQSNGSTLTGNATYKGAAVGKFAIRHGDTANAGHFTADAAITAKFGAWTTASDGPGLSGTIDNFRLNDGFADPGWRVSLKRAGWDGTDKYALSVGNTAAATTTAGGAAVEWSIDDSAAPGQTGQWEAQLFDEKADDGTNAPTTVVGKFEAGFGDTHKMVGAFGGNAIADASSD